MDKQIRIGITTGLIFLCIAVLLQERYAFHLFFIEQFQLFLFGEEYFWETVPHVGGLVKYIGEFCVQFFAYPYVGSIFSAFCIALIAYLISLLLKRIGNTQHVLFLFEAGIAFFLLLALLDLNFQFKGIVAYLFCLGCLHIYVSIKKYWLRMLTGGVLALFLLGGAASAFVCFVITSCVIELKSTGFNKGKGFFLLALSGLLCGAAYISGYIVYARMYFTPDSFYHPALSAGWVLYMPWVLLPVAVLSNSWVDQFMSYLKKEFIIIFVQVIVLLGIVVYLLPKFDDLKSIPVKSLNYYAMHNEWNKIIEYCRVNKGKDLLCLNYQNLALAEHGVLSDSLLYYRQEGGEGLFVDWNKTPFVSMTLSEICYRYGDISAARRYAFEGNVCSLTKGYPQTLKMLVRTNLLYGEYAVAEKYIDYLSRTLVYKDWANEQRRYLYNLKAIEESPEYADKQMVLHIENHLVHRYDFFELANVYNENRKLSDFILCYYLLKKKMSDFLDALRFFYVKEDSEELPDLYQEALIAYAQVYPEVLTFFSISPRIQERFEDYAAMYKSASNKTEQKDWTKLYYADSYWFYYHFYELK